MHYREKKRIKQNIPVSNRKGKGGGGGMKANGYQKKVEWAEV
jgi:hypothetical protein